MINKKISDLNTHALNNKSDYFKAQPFPHIVIDGFFKEKILNIILDEFPNNIKKNGEVYNNKAEKKLTLNEVSKLSKTTVEFINFLNSSIFIEYLQKITGIKEVLIPDPYLIGGGLHELRNEGFLNIHSDFNRHPKMKLDRRLNILVYLNKDWKKEYGGQIELASMDELKKFKSTLSLEPTFNRKLIFITDENSFHGQPNPVCHPVEMRRNSIATYYYTSQQQYVHHDKKKELIQVM